MSGQSAFRRLAEPVRRWIEGRGWTELRELQRRSIYEILDHDQDVILSAATAGGKTEAAFLPLISQRLNFGSGGGFDILYVAPLKALITDQFQRLESLCDLAGLAVTPWHGDIGGAVKTRALKSPAGILLITPESLEALFIRRGNDIPRLFNGTRAVVIDELHTLLESERGIQLRSLLARMDARLGRRLRRIGLSATLGDAHIAASVLNPDDPGSVVPVIVKGGGDLQLQLRGYIDGDEAGPPAEQQISDHLFRHLRGSDNLIFAGSRESVELFADRLRRMSDDCGVPNEFYPHHASLSPEHRNFVEDRLKAAKVPTSAVCTSTLELGIDIGDVACVAQIGAPYSVAALEQRLGRSGRRKGHPKVLRHYVIESRLTSQSALPDRLRLRLLRSVAMIELLIGRWCEKPDPRGLHLSTLVHQILALLAERGGARADQLYLLLCHKGPFRNISAGLFQQVLRAMGSAESQLIEQGERGLLFPGLVGEKLVSHYSFYAVFKTPEEFRLFWQGQLLGTIPVDNMVMPRQFLIFSGRRWLIIEVQQGDKVILVEPAEAGQPPKFGGDPGRIQDHVILRMMDLLQDGRQPRWIDSTATLMLEEARREFTRLPFAGGSFYSTGPRNHVIATLCGTVGTTTLAFAFASRGYCFQQSDGFLELTAPQDGPGPGEVLAEMASGWQPSPEALPPAVATEKFHPFLTQGLLAAEQAETQVDPSSLARRAADILGWPMGADLVSRKSRGQAEA